MYSIDPAPLTLKEELKNDYVWLNGLSSNPDVLKRLKEDAPYDVIVSDMNQFPGKFFFVTFVFFLMCFKMNLQELLMK